MQTLGEALAGLGSGRRSGQPVHRNTRIRPGEEGTFWRPFNPRDRARYMAAAEKHDRLERLKQRRGRTGRRNGTLGHIGLEVLRELLRLVDFRTGRLDPAITTIADSVGRSIGAVVAALKRLKLAGFLDWMRRYVETGGQGRRGPQVKQTSNAYRLQLPEFMARLMASPLPDDETLRRWRDRELVTDYLVDDIRFNGGTAAISGDLGAALGRLAAAIDQRRE